MGKGDISPSSSVLLLTTCDGFILVIPLGLGEAPAAVHSGSRNCLTKPKPCSVVQGHTCAGNVTSNSLEYPRGSGCVTSWCCGMWKPQPPVPEAGVACRDVTAVQEIAWQRRGPRPSPRAVWWHIQHSQEGSQGGFTDTCPGPGSESSTFCPRETREFVLERRRKKAFLFTRVFV